MATIAERFAYAPALTTHAAPTKGSFFKRLVAAMQASRGQQALREIARHQHLIKQVQDLATPRSDADRGTLPF